MISSAVWVNIATYLGAPVSTTHAVVGGVMGAGIAVVGLVQPDSSTLLRLEHTDGNALTVALNAMGTSYEILSDDDLAQP